MSSIDLICSNQTIIFYMLGQASYLFVSMWLNSFLECVYLSSYISQLPFTAYTSKWIQFTNVYSFFSESLLYKIVTIYLSACNIAVMYLYKDI